MTRDEKVRAVWRDYGAGLLDDEGASRALEELAKPPSPPRGPRPPPSERSQRRRRWVAAGYLPPRLAALFTPAETAAIAVMAQEIRARGACAFPIDKIAALAGCSRTSVKNALRLARLYKVLLVSERRVSRRRNLPNWVTACPELSAWLGGRGQKRDRHEYQDISKRVQVQAPGLIRERGPERMARCEARLAM